MSFAPANSMGVDSCLLGRDGKLPTVYQRVTVRETGRRIRKVFEEPSRSLGDMVMAKVAAAVLRRAILDLHESRRLIQKAKVKLVNNRLMSTTRDRKRYLNQDERELIHGGLSAYEWIYNEPLPGGFNAFTLEKCCDLLGLSAETVRREAGDMEVWFELRKQEAKEARNAKRRSRGRTQRAERGTGCPEGDSGSQAGAGPSGALDS